MFLSVCVDSELALETNRGVSAPPDVEHSGRLSSAFRQFVSSEGCFLSVEGCSRGHGGLSGHSEDSELWR